MSAGLALKALCALSNLICVSVWRSSSSLKTYCKADGMLPGSTDSGTPLTLYIMPSPPVIQVLQLAIHLNETCRMRVCVILSRRVMSLSLNEPAFSTPSIFSDNDSTSALSSVMAEKRVSLISAAIFIIVVRGAQMEYPLSRPSQHTASPH